MRDIKKIIDRNIVLEVRVEILEEEIEKLRKNIKLGGKYCTDCGEFKTYSNFHKNNATKDGFTYYCKDCIKAQHEKNK